MKRLTDTGPEWLLHLLADLSKHDGALVVLIFWRIWFVRNELVHNKEASQSMSWQVF